ncbi:MAG: GNAT family N-acetyltransferase [Alphaproteobacteria bacterium]|nr:GNAT family N-acetyltransferase [Alphaproteobacteria bacterium]
MESIHLYRAIMQSVEPVWVVRTETLEFRLGPLRLGNFHFTAMSLLSNPFLIDPNLSIPIEDAVAKGSDAVVRYGMPVSPRFPALRVERRSIRYVARYGLRYIVEFDGSFEDYLQKFSRKSRHELRRTVRKFCGHRLGQGCIAEYRTPTEIKEFRQMAIQISQNSYKEQIGWGFDESETFARQLESDASHDIARGFVLLLGEKPAAYGFCRAEQDVIVYKHTGYDEQFAQGSPGKVLLYLMLERLFSEGEFRLLDFDGMERYPYTEFFATRIIDCARVFWFRPTFRNLVVVGCHWVMATTWRFAARLRRFGRRSTNGWPSVRRLSNVWARVLTRPRRIA